MCDLISFRCEGQANLVILVLPYMRRKLLWREAHIGGFGDWLSKKNVIKQITSYSPLIASAGSFRGYDSEDHQRGCVFGELHFNG